MSNDPKDQKIDWSKVASSIPVLKMRGDTYDRLMSDNPVINDREIIFVKDVDGYVTSVKVGNGVDHFVKLPTLYDKRDIKNIKEDINDLKSDNYCNRRDIEKLYYKMHKQDKINKLMTAIISILVAYNLFDTIMNFI